MSSQEQVGPTFPHNGLPAAQQKLAFTKRLYDFSLDSIDILVREISDCDLEGNSCTLLYSAQHAR